MRKRRLAFCLALLLPTAVSAAPEGYLFGGFLKYSLKTRLTSGISIRMSERDPELVAKLSNPGQNELCAPNDCGDIAGAQKLTAAAGTFAGVNADDGNWNYAQYHIVSASTRLAPELILSAGNLR